MNELERYPETRCLSNLYNDILSPLVQYSSAQVLARTMLDASKLGFPYASRWQRPKRIVCSIIAIAKAILAEPFDVPCSFFKIQVGVLVDPSSTLVEERDLYEIMMLYKDYDITYGPFELVKVELDFTQNLYDQITTVLSNTLITYLMHPFRFERFLRVTEAIDGRVITVALLSTDTSMRDPYVEVAQGKTYATLRSRSYRAGTRTPTKCFQTVLVRT